MAHPDLRSRLLAVKLLALDVDGVLTDGGLYYGPNGDVWQRFNIKDGQGIKQVMRAGIEVAVITAKALPSTVHRTQELGIRYIYLGVQDKLSIVQDLCEQLSLSLSQVAYVGDDVNDLPVLRAVGCPLTVADAIADNRSVAVYTTLLPGGHGAVREICDLLLHVQPPVNSANHVNSVSALS